jgi:glycerate kinase
MKKFVLIPDSFKGTMSSGDICRVMAAQILKHYPGAEVRSIPVADGGEGTVDAWLAALGGEKIHLPAQGPYGEAIEAFYGLLDGGATAVIEMAACAGLPLAGTRLEPDQASTYGVGLLIRDAAARGCTKIILGLGGSATNDFGAGAAAAAGIRFLDRDGAAFIPVGATLSRIARIDRSALPPAFQRVEIICMCDIDNPLYGPQGAAYVFAPQKGADPALTAFLDTELRAAAATVKQELGFDVAALPGAGAAGGMGGGMHAFFGARLQMGIETLLDAADFERLITGADLIITGEGRIDTQSLRGKAVIGIARRAKKRGVPVIAIVGDIGDDIGGIYDEGIRAVFSINRVALPFREARRRAPQDLALTMDNLLRFIGSLEKGAGERTGGP